MEGSPYQIRMEAASTKNSSPKLWPHRPIFNTSEELSGDNTNLWSNLTWSFTRCIRKHPQKKHGDESRRFSVGQRSLRHLMPSPKLEISTFARFQAMYFAAFLFSCLDVNEASSSENYEIFNWKFRQLEMNTDFHRFRRCDQFGECWRIFLHNSVQRTPTTTNSPARFFFETLPLAGCAPASSRETCCRKPDRSPSLGSDLAVWSSSLTIRVRNCANSGASFSGTC